MNTNCLTTPNLGSLLGYRWALGAFEYRGSYQLLTRIAEWANTRTSLCCDDEENLPWAIKEQIGHGHEFVAFCENLRVTQAQFFSPGFAPAFLDSLLDVWGRLDGYNPFTSESEATTSANPDNMNLVHAVFMKLDGSYETVDVVT